MGNEQQRVEFYRWLRGWSPGARPVLLVGPPGTGKTTLVHLTSSSLDYFVRELNASDYRARPALEQVLASVSGGITVEGSRILLFLDEVDGLFSQEDRGGLEFLLTRLGRAKGLSTPLVMAANKEDDERVKKLAKQSMTLRIRPCSPRLIFLYLRELASRAGFELSEEDLAKVAVISEGDFRRALNLLVTLSTTKLVPPARKDRSLTLQEAVNAFFAAQDEEEARQALDACPLPPEDKLRALFSSVVSSGLEVRAMVPALRALADADLLLARIRRRRRWELLRYFTAMLTLLTPHLKPNAASFTEDWLPWPVKTALWNEAPLIRQLARTLARALHTSQAKTRAFCLPYLLLVKRDDLPWLARQAGTQTDSKALASLLRRLGLGP